MRALTKEQAESLLQKVKAFLSITWEDDDTDNKIFDFIKSGIAYLDMTAGIELDYWGGDGFKDELDVDGKLNKLYKNMSSIATDMLIARCYYMNEKALDDFDANYRPLMVALYSNGKCFNRILGDLHAE